MMTYNSRSLYFLGFLVCSGMMSYALYAEYILHLIPCPLCVLQRLAVSLTGVIFLIASIHNPRKNTKILYTLVIGISTLGGSSIAGWHVYLQNLPIDQIPSCGPGFDYLVGNFPLGEALLIIFSGSGECATVDWSFIYLSMPSWVFLSCMMLFALNVFTQINSSNK